MGLICSPLIVDDLVIVHGGEGVLRSLFAFSHRGREASLGGRLVAQLFSPLFAALAGVPQILSFNDGSVAGHNPTTGATLWENRGATAMSSALRPW